MEPAGAQAGKVRLGEDARDPVADQRGAGVDGADASGWHRGADDHPVQEILCLVVSRVASGAGHLDPTVLARQRGSEEATAHGAIPAAIKSARRAVPRAILTL